MMSFPVRIVQISDTHISANKNEELLGVKTAQSLQTVIDLLKTDNIVPDLIIHSGDLTQDGTEEAYLALGEQFSRSGASVHCIPGNHDNSEVMKKTYPYQAMSLQKQIMTDNWQIILLDSHIHGKVEGLLKHSELEFLKQCLEAHPKHHAIIFFHHHPIATGSAWLDKIGLTNSPELFQLLTNFQNVAAVFFGHVHQVVESQKNSISYYSAPSTCIQFKRNSAEFSLEKTPPGYRLIELYPDGTLQTSVKRAAQYVGTFDEESKGY